MSHDRRLPADEEVRRTDRRWFVTATVVFVGSFGGLLGAREVYHATGPHPEVTLFVRRVKLLANRLLRQRLKQQR
jgi:hypothetical protein